VATATVAQFVQLCFDRVAAILSAAELRAGTVGHAAAYLIDAAGLLPAALACLRCEPYYFVNHEMPA
jgi:hypothetical protein